MGAFFEEDEMTAEELAITSNRSEFANGGIVPEAEPQAEPQREAPPEPAAQPPPPPQREPQVVPLAVLLEERRRATEAERELATIRENRARFEERLLAVKEAQEARAAAERAAAEPPPPDPDVDPMAHANWVLQQERQAREQLQARVDQLDQNQRTTVEGYQATREEEWITREALPTLVAQAEPSCPDVRNALPFLMLHRDRMLAPIIPNHAERQEFVTAEARNLLATATVRDQTGRLVFTRNPVIDAYQMALQVGFRPGGQAPAPQAPPQPPAPTREVPLSNQRLSQLSRGVNESRSLSGAHGRAAKPQTLDASAFESMSDAELRALYDQDGGRTMDAILRAMSEG